MYVILNALWRGNPPIVQLTYQKMFSSGTRKPCMRSVGGIKRCDGHWLVIYCQDDQALPRKSIPAENPCCGSNMQHFLEICCYLRFWKVKLVKYLTWRQTYQSATLGTSLLAFTSHSGFLSFLFEESYQSITERRIYNCE